MKILWLVSSILPIVSELSGVPAGHTNGWMDLLSRKLLEDENTELVCLFPVHIKRKTVCGRSGRLKWYGFFEPKIAPVSYDRSRSETFRSVIRREKPDIIHIWGTEYGHCAEMADASTGSAPSVISIQGLISECARVYTDGIPVSVIDHPTLHDLVKRDGLKEQKIRFEKRGELELRALQSVRYVIGRTAWDKEKVTKIKPDITYYKCEEIMRKEFYSDEAWSYEECEKHSIFMSQSYYPIKGMHVALKIVKMLKKDYPDVHLYTTGRYPGCAAFTDFFRQNTYERYLCSIIKRYGLDDNVTYLGELDAAGMKERYLKTNVFLQASLIENSSNSLTEAMLLGTPVTASDVGGTASVLGEYAGACTYNIRKPSEAAERIKKIFEYDADLRSNPESDIRDYAGKVHDIDRVYLQYRECYADIDRRRTEKA